MNVSDGMGYIPVRHQFDVSQINLYVPNSADSTTRPFRARCNSFRDKCITYTEKEIKLKETNGQVRRMITDKIRL